LFSAITLLVLYFGMKEPRKHVQRSPFEERVL
jgi:hypothetical protein